MNDKELIAMIDPAVIHNFVYLNDYSGDLADMQQIVDALESPDEAGNCHAPYDKYDINNFVCIMWSFLVLYCGEYGTSPRYGWIHYPVAVYISKIIMEVAE